MIKLPDDHQIKFFQAVGSGLRSNKVNANKLGLSGRQFKKYKKAQRRLTGAKGRALTVADDVQNANSVR